MNKSIILKGMMMDMRDVISARDELIEAVSELYVIFKEKKVLTNIPNSMILGTYGISVRKFHLGLTELLHQGHIVRVKIQHIEIYFPKSEIQS